MRFMIDTVSQHGGIFFEFDTDIIHSLTYIGTSSIRLRAPESEAYSHIPLFSQPPPSMIPRPALILHPPISFLQPPPHMFISAEKMGITLTNPTQHSQCMSPFEPFHLCRSLLTTVLRNQVWPKHPSSKERHLKPGAAPSTMQ